MYQVEHLWGALDVMAKARGFTTVLPYPPSVVGSCLACAHAPSPLQILFSSSLTMTGVVSLYEAEKVEAWHAEQRVRLASYFFSNARPPCLLLAAHQQRPRCARPPVYNLAHRFSPRAPQAVASASAIAFQAESVMRKRVVTGEERVPETLVRRFIDGSVRTLGDGWHKMTGSLHGASGRGSRSPSEDMASGGVASPLGRREEPEVAGAQKSTKPAAADEASPV